MVVSRMGEGRGRCEITDFPDCILDSILSLLPLQDAVNTILASPPHWKHLSHSSILTRRNLEFDYDNILGSNYKILKKGYGGDQQEFVRRVSKYMQQYQGNKVDSFNFLWFVREESYVSLDDWIRFATTKGVEKLHLDLITCTSPHDGYEFPPSLHVGSTSSLKHLSLERCILRHPTADPNAFNQLTTLSLKHVYVDRSLLPNIFSVCALLESLTLDWCHMMNGGFYQNRDGCRLLAGERLTHLKVLHCEEWGHREISAPNLASLEYIPLCNWGSFHIQAPKLSRIFFVRVRDTLVPNALTHFVSSPGLETLHLRMPGELPRISRIPTYRNLKQLKLDIRISGSRKNDVNLVLDVMKAAPVLEELIIMVYVGDFCEANPRETRNDHPGFTNDHLRMFEMHNFKGNWYEMELVVCILEISPNLEKIVLNRLGRLYMGNGKFRCQGGQVKSFSEQQRRAVEEKLKGAKTGAEIRFL